MTTYPYSVLMSSNVGDTLVDWECSGHPDPDLHYHPLNADMTSWMRSNLEGAWSGLHDFKNSEGNWYDELRFENAEDAALFTMKWL